MTAVGLRQQQRNSLSGKSERRNIATGAGARTHTALRLACLVNTKTKSMRNIIQQGHGEKIVGLCLNKFIQATLSQDVDQALFPPLAYGEAGGKLTSPKQYLGLNWRLATAKFGPWRCRLFGLQ